MKRGGSPGFESVHGTQPGLPPLGNVKEQEQHKITTRNSEVLVSRQRSLRPLSPCFPCDFRQVNLLSELSKPVN